MTNGTPEVKIDALSPAQMAVKAEAVGVKKATMAADKLFVLGLLAGAFIGLGAIFATTIATGGSALPFGVKQMLVGLVFCVGLILVVVAGAELFTGNNLVVIALLSKKITTGQLLYNWGIVYLGNFVGSVLLAFINALAQQHMKGGGQVGVTALNIANAKCGLDFVPALALGIMCNFMVCLAVWLTFSARSATDKVLLVLFPIAGFVAAGFEHSVANMYFISSGLFIKSGAPAAFWNQIGMAASDFADLTWGNFFIKNLLPVTLGNIIGGSVMVAFVYWYVYLRNSE
ncbi:MAG: formate transporter FocA [Anaerolineae bacterium]|nr:formate transporter FocA [Anaerolineae bacterium]